MKRRDFLRQTAAAAAVTCCPGQSVGQQARPGESRHPARHWQGLASQRVRCTLCPRACTMGPGERGYCGVRKNEGGRLMTLVHSRPCSLRSDPIEKKPLFHYLPGTDSFSLATAGCNLACQFCQNWRISQFRPSEVASVHLTPRQVVDRARAAGARSIAFTYSEPIVFYEYMYDIARLAHEAGLGRVMISNGYITPPPSASCWPCSMASR